MTAKVEERISEIFRWYEYNRGLIPKENLMKRLDFQQKAIDCLFEVVVLQAECIQLLEFKAGVRSNKLWLPNGVQINGDLTKFG